MKALVKEWAQGAGSLDVFEGTSTEERIRWFYLQTLQRKLKDAGRFVYIDRVKGNPDFLRFIPSSLRYVRQAMNWLAKSEDWGASFCRVLESLDPALRES